MRRSRFFAFALLGAFALLDGTTRADAAEQPTQGDRALQLDDALDLARRNNRDLRAARARLDQAAVSIEQAWTALLPTAAAQGKYTHNYKEVALDLAQFSQGTLGLANVIKATSRNPAQNGAINQLEQSMTEALNRQDPIVIQKAEQLDASLLVTIPLVVPSAYSGLAAARRTYRAAEANFALTEASLLFSVAQAFFTGTGADEIVRARHHAVEVARKTRDDARARFAAGVVNRVEVARAQLALERTEQAEREAADGRTQAYRGIATLLLLREPFRVVASAVPPPHGERPHELTPTALKLRPEMTALERNIDAARTQIASAKWRWAPTLSAFGNVRAFNYKSFSGDPYSWAVGAELDWTLYDGGVRSALVHLHEAEWREGELRLAQLRDTIADEVASAEEQLATKWRAVETAESAVRLSDETLALVRVQHDAGTATQLDLLQAQDALMASELSLAQARFDLALADLALQRVIGTFPGKRMDRREKREREDGHS